MVSFSRQVEEEKRIQELERWHKDMVKLQSLVNKGNWADDTDSKSFALHIAERLREDLLQRIQERRSQLTVVVVDHNPVSVSDSDTERIRANKRQRNQLDEQRIDSSSLNPVQSHRNRRRAGSKRDICKTNKNSEEQKSEDRNGKIMNQRIVPKEKANDDGLEWRKYGSKCIRNEIHPRDYYKCASKGCPAKKTFQRVDLELVRIVYYEVHNCGTQNPLVMKQQREEETGSDQDAGVADEAQPEQHQSPSVPQPVPDNVDFIPQHQQTPVIQQEAREDMMSSQPNDGALSSQIQGQREQQHDPSLQLQLKQPIVHNDKISLQQSSVDHIPQFHQQQQQPPVIQKEARGDMMSRQPNGGVLNLLSPTPTQIPNPTHAQQEQQHDQSHQLRLPIMHNHEIGFRLSNNHRSPLSPQTVHNDGIGSQLSNNNLLPLFQQEQQQQPTIIQKETGEDMMSRQPNSGVLNGRMQVQREQQHDHWSQPQPQTVHNDVIGLQLSINDHHSRFQQEQQQQLPFVQQEGLKDMVSCQPNSGVLNGRMQVQREQQNDHWYQPQPQTVHNDRIGLQLPNNDHHSRFQQEQQQQPTFVQQEALKDMVSRQPNSGVLNGRMQVQREHQHDNWSQPQPQTVHNDGIGLQLSNNDLHSRFQHEQQQQPTFVQQQALKDMVSCQPNSGVLNRRMHVQREQQHDHWSQSQPQTVHNDGIGSQLYNNDLLPLFQQEQQQQPTIIQQETREDMMSRQPNSRVLNGQTQVQQEQQHDHWSQPQPQTVHNDGIGLQLSNNDLHSRFQQEQQQQPTFVQQQALKDMVSCQPNSGVLNRRIQVQREQQHDRWSQSQPQTVHNDMIGSQLYNNNLLPLFQQEEQQQPTIIQQETREDMMSRQPNSRVLNGQTQVQQEHQYDHWSQPQPQTVHNDEIGIEYYNFGLGSPTDSRMDLWGPQL